MKICLDPGHGGKDSGAVGFNLKESDSALKIAIEIKNILKNHGIDVLLTRSDDIFIPLYERAYMSNKANCDYFISIHHNSAANPNARGYETWVYSERKTTQDFVNKIHSEIVGSKLFSIDRGIKNAPFTVLTKTEAPAILLELGFINNKDDNALITSKWKSIASVIANAILKFQNIPNIIPEQKERVNEIPPSNYAMSACKKAVSCGLFADINNDGSLDRPKDYLKREELVVILDRLGYLDKRYD